MWYEYLKRVYAIRPNGYFGLTTFDGVYNHLKRTLRMQTNKCAINVGIYANFFTCKTQIYYEHVKFVIVFKSMHGMFGSP